MVSRESIERTWSWIDDGILAFALAVMRALWVSVLVRVLSLFLPVAHADLIGPVVVLALLVMGTLVAQYVTFRTRANGPALVMVVGGGVIAVLLALYFSIPARGLVWNPGWLHVLVEAPLTSFAVLALAVWLWRWSVVTVRSPLGYDTYAGNFLVGLAAFALAIYVSSNARLVAPSSLVLPLLLFFALGLGTLAVASLASSRRFEQTYSKQSFALNRYWLGTVALMIGLILGVGFILSQLFVPEVAASAVALLSALLNVVAAILATALLVVAFLFYTPLEFLVHLFHLRINFLGMPTSTAMPTWGEFFKNVQQEPFQGFPPEVYTVLKLVGAALLVAGVLLIFARAFRRVRGLSEGDIDEEHETLLSTDLLKKQLADLLARRRRARHGDLNPFLPLSGQAPDVQVRRIYQGLLAWATERGIPRPAGATPSEYQVLLASQLALDAEGLALITNSYLQARYGPERISAAQADEVARTWERLARAGRAAGSPRAV